MCSPLQLRTENKPRKIFSQLFISDPVTVIDAVAGFVPCYCWYFVCRYKSSTFIWASMRNTRFLEGWSCWVLWVSIVLPPASCPSFLSICTTFVLIDPSQRHTSASTIQSHEHLSLLHILCASSLPTSFCGSLPSGQVLMMSCSESIKDLSGCCSGGSRGVPGVYWNPLKILQVQNFEKG